MAEAPGLPWGLEPAGRCCVYFLLLVRFGFCVGGSCEQKGDGGSVVRGQPVLSTLTFEPVISGRSTAAGFTPSFSKRIFPP